MPSADYKRSYHLKDFSPVFLPSGKVLDLGNFLRQVSKYTLRGPNLTPLALIYWARAILGIIAGSISAVLTLSMGERGLNTFLNGLTIALVVYLITFYIIKAKFKHKVEKPSKLMTQGIGFYFFAWIFSWVLIYTMILGPT